MQCQHAKFWRIRVEFELSMSISFHSNWQRLFTLYTLYTHLPSPHIWWEAIPIRGSMVWFFPSSFLSTRYNRLKDRSANEPLLDAYEVDAGPGCEACKTSNHGFKSSLSRVAGANPIYWLLLNISILVASFIIWMLILTTPASTTNPQGSRNALLKQTSMHCTRLLIGHAHDEQAILICA